MKLLFESLSNFERNLDSKKSINVGNERADNPNNLGNQNSYLISKTNEEFIEDIRNKVDEFSMVLEADLNPLDYDGYYAESKHPESSLLMDKFQDIQESLADLLDVMKNIKR